MNENPVTLATLLFFFRLGKGKTSESANKLILGDGGKKIRLKDTNFTGLHKENGNTPALSL